MANLVLDLGNAVDRQVSLVSLSGQTTQVGAPVDLLGASFYCNLFVSTVGLSGVLPCFIQTSPDTVSGNFTDPTSGLPTTVFPIGGKIVSGGIFYANSGIPGSGYSSPQAPISGAPAFCSGGTDYAAFQRPDRYARVVLTSGTPTVAAAIVLAGFVEQKIVTGSGGGFSQSPLPASVVNV